MRLSKILKPGDHQFVLLLRMAPMERRPRGWRWGTKRIPDRIVDRLVAAGKAVRSGDAVIAA
jgi:hypothetical protein